MFGHFVWVPKVFELLKYGSKEWTRHNLQLRCGGCIFGTETDYIHFQRREFLCDIRCQALVFLNPRRIAMTGCYMGVQKAVQQFKGIRNGDLELVDIDDEFRDGDLCWIETPINPTGESKSIKYYADKVLVLLRWTAIVFLAYP